MANKLLTGASLIFLLGLHSAVAATFADLQLDPSDVSILLPLPRSISEAKRYPKARELLPREFLLNLSFDIRNPRPIILPSDPSIYSSLTALGIRLDPCFREHFGDGCQPQIRLVLQPLIENAFQSYSTSDYAVHLFYPISRKELRELLTRIRKSRTSSERSGGALRVNPLISRQGIGGTFANALFSGINPLVKFERLSRVAFFMKDDSGETWFFKSFDKFGNEAAAVPIHGVSATYQSITNSATGSNGFDSDDESLANPVGDQLFEVLRRSSQANLKKAALLVSKIERPSLHLPGTIDCLSCHATAPVRFGLSKMTGFTSREDESFILQALKIQEAETPYASNYETNRFILFGYNGSSPIIGQRVMNETDAVLKYLRQNP